MKCKHCHQTLSYDPLSGQSLPPYTDHFGHMCPVRSTQEGCPCFCEAALPDRPQWKCHYNAKVNV